ncbi:hypothetical protein SISNIDRAFT_104654 [Sistotremastrum niveocremeum HHB9708]|uniref:Uncharacterized protein n=1 Tax=Sistotremastrum niveocremeum HHB9708 TaxID=1314777 RepID=A0A164TTC5_9AGAM|nr:hypothetical protein SISNIDRAFT_104654 [Sistotremastrum niveocremeum HHB9708]
MNQGGWAAPGNMNMGMNPTAFQMNAGSSSQPMLQYINPSTMALPSHAGSPQGASSHAWQQQQNAAAQQQQQYGSGGTGAGSPAGSIHHSERAATPRHASATPVPSAVLGEPEFDATSMYTWG